MRVKHLEPLARIRIVFAVILISLSVFMYLQGTAVGFVFILIALYYLIQKGFEIDLDKKRYRKIYSIFNIDVGFWKPLPNAEYISVFKTVQNNRIRGKTSEATYGFMVYKVNLFYAQNKYLEVYITDEKEDAFKVANHIAMVLDVEVFDATEKG